MLFFNSSKGFQSHIIMGNCINKNRLYMLTNCNFRIRGSEDYFPNDIGVERDNAVNQNQNYNAQFGKNHVQNNRTSNRPPSSGKKERQQSHPLPTPIPRDDAYESEYDDESNIKGNDLLPVPLPKPDERSTTAACVLPLPTDNILLSSPNLKSFSLEQLRRATEDFSSFLGEGGFGCVFKGWLDEATLTAATLTPSSAASALPVAVKKLIPNGFQGHKEWLSEVTYLGRLHHPNLVKLIGYCLDADDRILVYEFMPGGSLENLLFTTRNSPTLSWARRIKVAVGAARGLCFLHELASPVIYRDFKTSNVLLDSEFNAKLSDFGLAKAGPTESQTHVTTRVMGTQGYCDPCYIATGKLTVKCDVYSFGVVLLELLTGRAAIDETKFEEEKKLVNWSRDHLNNNGKVSRIMDSRLQGQYCKRSAFVVANIALRCVNLQPKYRPPMTYILDILLNLPSYKNTIHP